MCEDGAAHFKAFCLPYLRGESCGERLRVPLLKQTRRLSITPHSSQSQSCLFKSSFSCCAFILHRGLFRAFPPSPPFTTTVIATNQQGKVSGMGLTLTTLKQPSLLPTSAMFTTQNYFTCR